MTPRWLFDVLMTQPDKAAQTAKKTRGKERDITTSVSENDGGASVFDARTAGKLDAGHRRPILRGGGRAMRAKWAKWAMVAAVVAASACGGARVQQPDLAFGSGMWNLDDDGRFPLERAPVRAAVAPQLATVGAARPVSLPPRPPLAAPLIQPASQPRPAAPANATLPNPPDADDTVAGKRVEAAVALLGSAGIGDRALIEAALTAAGQRVEVAAGEPYAARLFDTLQRRGRIGPSATVRPGDLVFFRDTADLDGNGRPGDGVALVGVVERVDGARAVFVASRAGKVRRLAVDPTRPTVVRDAEGVRNTRLVRWPGRDEAMTAGECFAGYGRP
jgi:hypothetical protein